MKKQKRLLAVQGPLQFITGYIAFDWYGRHEGSAANAHNVLLLYDFLCAPEVEAAIVESVRALAGVTPWADIVFISGADMASIVKGRYSTSIARLHERLGHAQFDEIFLARDHIGEGSPLLMNAYARATKLAYGDSFGLVGQRNLFAAFDRRSPVRSAASAVKRAAKRALLGAPADVPFDAAVLTLPLDMSGSYLSTIPLIVPPRAHAVDTVTRLSRLLPGLRAYMQSLIAQGTGTSDHLFLLSNLAASGLTSLEGETALYVDVVEQTVPAGSTVFIKHHPRSSEQVLHAVLDRLASRYRAVVLDDAEMSRMPIEIWTDLIAHCALVPMFSTSAINLKYLYGKDVMLPLNESRIRRYFLSDKADYARSVDGMIRQSIDNLDRWDGRSALWTRNA
jgi:hypothetical protein